MAKLSADDIYKVKKFMAKKEWVTRTEICNAIGCNSANLQYFLNSQDVKSRQKSTKKSREYALVDAGNQLQAKPFEAYSPPAQNLLEMALLTTEKSKARVLAEYCIKNH